MILITARVTTTCGDELFNALVETRCDELRPPNTLLLLLNKWLRHGGLSDPSDPSQPNPDPEESESVDVCAEEEVADEWFWEPSFEPLSELWVIEETPLVLPLLHP